MVKVWGVVFVGLGSMALVNSLVAGYWPAVGVSGMMLFLGWCLVRMFGR